ILVALSISWLLLYLIEKNNILALGFLPIAKRSKQFFIGFIITGLFCALVQVLESHLKSSTWIINSNITSGVILESLWWDIRSVLTEELIFRGALLYILIQRIGSRNGIILSAIAFGIYHWFSFGVLGNLLAMILVFIGTGLMGYALAWAFSKTKSIMLPFGLHLGWNFVHNTVFSKGPLGEIIFIQQDGNELAGWLSLLNFVTGILLAPAIVMLYVGYFVENETE
ncbi:MAG: CPBP family intramembrane glutamic endopeptidase, partial [Luteibaculum sp.]